MKPTIRYLIFLIMSTAMLQAQTKAIADGLLDSIRAYDAAKLKSGVKGPVIADTIKVNLLNSLTSQYLLTDSKKADVIAGQALSLSRQINYKSGIAYSLVRLSLVRDIEGEYAESIETAREAIALLKKLGDKPALADTYSHLGIVYCQLGNYPESMRYSLIALKMYEQEKNDLYMIKAYSNIAILYKQQKKYKEALDTNYKAIEILSRSTAPEASYFRHYIENDIGNIMVNQKKGAEALPMQLKLYKSAGQFDDAYLNANIATNIADSYSQKGEHKQAEEYYSQALKSYKQMNDAVGQADSFIAIGNSQFLQNKPKLALFWVQKGAAMAENLQNTQLLQDAYNVLARIHSKLGNYREAFTNQQLFSKMTDSLFNIEKDKKFTEFRMEYDFTKKQQQLQLEQQKKQAVMKLGTARERNHKNAILGMIVAVSLVAGGIYYNLRRHQKQKHIIERQKQLVEQQQEKINAALLQKETLLREIHHRVKNNLQIISSLLNIQSQGITDEKVLESIQEGQSRVQAMSLIHQNLYQSESINNVDIENYLRELVNYLATMFKDNSKTIHVDIQTSGLNFDIDTAIPLGLIVNELVSNAYKYAFENRSEGQINIQIKALSDVDYKLEVDDNGNGLAADYDHVGSKSLGLKLVRILGRQLRGNLSLASEVGHTSFIVSFKDLKAYQTAQV